RLVNVGFSRHIDRRERRDERRHAEHEPKAFAYGPPVVEQMYFAFATLRPITIDPAAIIRRIIEPAIDFARFVFALNEFGSLVHSWLVLCALCFVLCTLCLARAHAFLDRPYVSI